MSTTYGPALRPTPRARNPSCPCWFSRLVWQTPDPRYPWGWRVDHTPSRYGSRRFAGIPTASGRFRFGGSQFFLRISSPFPEPYKAEGGASPPSLKVWPAIPHRGYRGSGSDEPRRTNQRLFEGFLAGGAGRGAWGRDNGPPRTGFGRAQSFTCICGANVIEKEHGPAARRVAGSIRGNRPTV